MDMSGLEQRVEKMEKRLALYELLASYGPAVDSGSAEAVARLWADDGTYDFGDAVLTGRVGVEKMVHSRAHQELIDQGAAHLIGFPHVHIDGDHAVAVGYSQVARFQDGAFELWRVSANRWELDWDGSEWKVKSRRAYLLDGREEARELLRPDTPS